MTATNGNGIDTSSLRYRALTRLVRQGGRWSAWRLSRSLNLAAGEIRRLAEHDPWFARVHRDDTCDEIGITREGARAAKAAGLLCLLPGEKTPAPDPFARERALCRDARWPGVD